MKVKMLGILAALLLVVNQFFLYPICAQEATSSGELCCSEPSEVEISDNGPGSDNRISETGQSEIITGQENQVTLTSSIKINANTGDNKASDNDGDVSITTGMINSYTQISNFLNSSDISASKLNPKSSLKVSGNGSGSTSSLEESLNNNEDLFVYNNLVLNNNVRNYATTGKNKAKRNSGTVFISTGDVYLAAILSNITNTSKIIESPWKTQGLSI